MSENKEKVILTFDVELWNEGQWLKPYITPDMLVNDPFPNSIEKILKVLKEKNANATFFVTLEVTEKYPKILKNMVEAGHEIGIHGPKHIRLNEYNQKIFKSDCARHIGLITAATGKRPKGFRAAHFSLNKKTMWVLPILKELGFTYDSSIFPINMGEYGISNTPLKTYEIIPSILEIPISVSTFWGLRFPFAGGIYFRFFPLLIFKFLLNRSVKTLVPVVYFHPHELDPNTPRITTGPWLRRILKYWGIKRSFIKFKKLSNYYTFVSINRALP